MDALRRSGAAAARRLGTVPDVQREAEAMQMVWLQELQSVSGCFLFVFLETKFFLLFFCCFFLED